MASYHRVLRNFERSVNDKAMECNYDIHPWDILIDDKRWPGKIRLIGYIDLFFLICYSGESRFEKGLVIYKDDKIIRELLENSETKANEIKLVPLNSRETEESHQKYYRCSNEKHGNYYVITSLGHPMKITPKYPRSCLKSHTIRLYKGKTPAMQKEIRRGVIQHGIPRLIGDALRIGTVSAAEFVSKITNDVVGGSSISVTTEKTVNALITKDSHNMALSATEK